VHRLDRAAINHLDQVLTLLVEKPRGLVRRLAIDQPLRSMGVELEYSIAHHQQCPPPICAASVRGGALIDSRKSQKRSGLRRTLSLLGQQTKLERVKVR
jgi:hypothetical protein